MGKNVTKELTDRVLEIALAQHHSVIFSHDLLFSVKEKPRSKLGKVGIRHTMLDCYSAWYSFFNREDVRSLTAESAKAIIIPPRVIERMSDDLGQLSKKASSLSKKYRNDPEDSALRRASKSIQEIEQLYGCMSNLSNKFYSDLENFSFEMANCAVKEVMNSYNLANPGDKVVVFPATMEYIAISLISMLFSRKSTIVSRNLILHQGFKIFYNILYQYAVEHDEELKKRLEDTMIRPSSVVLYTRPRKIRVYSDSLKCISSQDPNYHLTDIGRLSYKCRESLENLARKHWLR